MAQLDDRGQRFPRARSSERFWNRNSFWDRRVSLEGNIAAPQPGASGGFAAICFNANAFVILALHTAGTAGPAIGGGMVGLAMKQSKAVGVMSGTSQGVNAGFFFNVERIAPGS
jgi:hypothetical protein